MCYQDKELIKRSTFKIIAFIKFSGVKDLALDYFSLRLSLNPSGL